MHRSGMNFATKDRFCLNLVIYRKSDTIQYPVIKGHNSDNFEIIRKLE